MTKLALKMSLTKSKISCLVHGERVIGSVTLSLNAIIAGMNAERKIGLPVVDTQRIVEGVPDYTEFMTGAELFDSTRRLVKDNWKMVQDGRLEWRILGQSAKVDT